LHPHRFRNWIALVGLALLCLALDQWTKRLVVQNLAVGEAWAPIPALSKVFTITHVQNTGVAFGQLSGLGWLFMVVNLAVFVGILVYSARIAAGHWSLRLAVALILAGDLGNVIDRLRTASRFAAEAGTIWKALPRAYVTDFFDFKVWPVFNVADLCLVTGVVIMAWLIWQAEKAQGSEQILARDQ